VQKYLKIFLYKSKNFRGFCEKSHPPKRVVFLDKINKSLYFVNRMILEVRLDSLSFKYLKHKDLLNLSADDSKDDYIGTVIFAMFREFEYERKHITDLLKRNYNYQEHYFHIVRLNIPDRKVRNIKRTEIHFETLRRINKFIHKQFYMEYCTHMRVVRHKYKEHKEDSTYEFLKIFDLDESDIKAESLLRLWSRKRHQYSI